MSEVLNCKMLATVSSQCPNIEYPLPVTENEAYVLKSVASGWRPRQSASLNFYATFYMLKRGGMIRDGWFRSFRLTRDGENMLARYGTQLQDQVNQPTGDTQ